MNTSTDRDSAPIRYARWEFVGTNMFGQRIKRCTGCGDLTIDGRHFCTNCGAMMGAFAEDTKTPQD